MAELESIRRAAVQSLVSLMDDELGVRGRGKITRFFPDEGPYRRALYPKHLAFFAAGLEYRERGAISANRVGKSVMGAFEVTLHLTGDYPEWWPGRRFEAPVTVWACGDTSKTVRGILQQQLLGSWGQFGSGFIPRHRLTHVVNKRGTPNAVDTAWVKHASGGNSTLLFKSYEEGREAFQGEAIEVILCDEEPPEDVREECLLRTLKTSDFPGGILLLTFTPLRGHTSVVKDFYPRVSSIEDDEARLLPALGAERHSELNEEAYRWLRVGDVSGAAKRWRVRITWDDVPHIDEAEKADMEARLRPYQRDARMRGIPQLGSGAIWPFPVSEFKVPPFEIPTHFARGWAADAQALWKSSLHGALDRETGVLYIYREFKRELATVSDHAASIVEAGAWIPGVGDAMGLVREGDRTQYIDLYRSAGLDIVRADKAVEPGIQDVFDMIAKGLLKVFSTLTFFFDEFEAYQRDAKGRVVKENDHLMDCIRMLARGYIARGDNWMKTPKEGNPDPEDVRDRLGPGIYDGDRGGGWM